MAFAQPQTVDIILVCAIEVEYRAAQRIWKEYAQAIYTEVHHDTLTYHHATMTAEDGTPRSLLLALMPHMGGDDVAHYVRSLIDTFMPQLVVMTGICAGDRQKVALGDIIVAERTFPYDRGKMIRDAEGNPQQLHDITTWSIPGRMVQMIKQFEGWHKVVSVQPRPPSLRQQRDWLLHQLMSTTPRLGLFDPDELAQYAPNWRTIVAACQHANPPLMTEEGELREGIKEELCFGEAAFPFRDAPLARHIGVIASGGMVRADILFPDLQRVVRTTIGLDMEAAAVMQVVERYRDHGIEGLVIKGVSDYGDSEKDDRYHTYAAEVSALYALTFLQSYLTAIRFPPRADHSPRNSISGFVGNNTIIKDTTIVFTPGSAPPVPSLVIGRNDDLQNLKMRLGMIENNAVHILTAMRGWPGVGKTTLAAMIAHDHDINATFPDGVLWTSLGQNPSILSKLAEWGRALGIDDLIQCQSIEEASSRLTMILKQKRTLLIIDDVWKSEHVQPFRVGGPQCVVLITTRLNDVAAQIAPSSAIYKLNVLSDENALLLLKELASEIVAAYPKQCEELVKELEGLPLALQVAGRLLQNEASYGFGVEDLIRDLRVGVHLLEAKAPADRGDLANQTTPTVAALLQKSTEVLDAETRECFACLGPFAPKPATFDLAAMAALWPVSDPKPIVRTLVDRGLLEFVKELSRYQMHALLVLHANSLLED